MYGGYGDKSALGGIFAPWPRGWGSLLTRSHYKDIALRWKSRGLSVILRGRRRSDAILRIHLTIGFGCTGCILQWGSFLGRSRSDRAVLFRGRPRHPHGALQPLTFQERPPRAVFFFDILPPPLSIQIPCIFCISRSPLFLRFAASCSSSGTIIVPPLPPVRCSKIKRSI